MLGAIFMICADVPGVRGDPDAVEAFCANAEVIDARTNTSVLLKDVDGRRVLRLLYGEEQACVDVSNVCGSIGVTRLKAALRWVPKTVLTGEMVTETAGLHKRTLWNAVTPNHRGCIDTRSFFHRSDALEEAARRGQIVIGVEKERGRRDYHSLFRSELSDFLRMHPHSYSSMQTGKTMLYFDLDANYDDAPELKDNIPMQQREVYRVIDHAIAVMAEVGVTCDRDDFYILTSNRAKKMSYHIYSTGFYFETYGIMRVFARRTIQRVNEDPDVYRFTRVYKNDVKKVETIIDPIPYCDEGQNFRIGAKFGLNPPVFPTPVTWHTPRIAPPGETYSARALMPHSTQPGARVVRFEDMDAAARDAVVAEMGTVATRPLRVSTTQVVGGVRMRYNRDMLPKWMPMEMLDMLIEKGAHFSLALHRRGDREFVKVSLDNSSRSDHTVECGLCNYRHATLSSMWASVYENRTVYWHCNLAPRATKRPRVDSAQ